MPSQQFILKMFNDDVLNKKFKADFLATTLKGEDTNNAVKHVSNFNLIGAVEQKLNKDLCEFKKEEIISMFEYLGWVAASTFFVKKSLVLSYLNWAKQNGRGTTNIDEIRKLSSSDLESDDIFSKSYFKDFQELVLLIQAIKQNELRLKNIFDINRYAMIECILYLMWLRPRNINDIFNIKKSDIDFESGYITIGKEKYLAPDELLDVATTCISQRYAQVKCGKSGVNTKVFGFSDYLLRAVELEQINFGIMIAMVSSFNRLSKNLENPIKEIRYKKIIDSSLFYDIYQKEIELGTSYQPSNKPGEEYHGLKDHFGSEINGTVLRNYFKWRKAFYGA